VTSKPTNQKNTNAILSRASRKAIEPRPVPDVAASNQHHSSRKKVKLETIATVFPIWITCEVRRRKLQIFLDLPSLTISSLL
jgi:hypothetical protein